MPDLKHIQENLFNALTGQHTHNASDLTPCSRLTVYQSAYRSRLEESLVEDFPRTLDLMGDQSTHIIDDYLNTQISKFWNLAQYSQKFPAHVANRYDAGIEHLAKVEWAACVARAIGHQHQTASEIPSDPLTFVINDSLQTVVTADRFFTFVWDYQGIQEEDTDPPTGKIWNRLIDAWKRGDSLDSTMETAVDPELLLTPQHLGHVIQSLTTKGILLGFRPESG